DGLFEIGVFLAEARVVGLPGENGGVGERAVDLLRAFFDLTELVKHRGSAPPGQARPSEASCRARIVSSGRYPWAGVAGSRLYLRWKRSTRPAVSMNFCLPV